MKITSAKSLQLVALTGLFLLTSAGCSSGTTSATTSGTTTPTQPSQPIQPVAPPVPAGWVNVAKSYFSFDYPSTWQLSESTYRGQPILSATEPTQQHQFFVQFVQGFVQHPVPLVPCYDVNAYLNSFYTDVFLPLETAPGKYPRTSVTWNPLPVIGGSLGGSIGYVSVVTQQAVGGSLGGYQVELQGVPRADGLYLVGIVNPDHYATPSLEQTFLSTFFMVSNPLPKGSDCSIYN